MVLAEITDAEGQNKELPLSTVLLKLHLQLFLNLLGQRYQKCAEKMQVF